MGRVDVLASAGEMFFWAHYPSRVEPLQFPTACACYCFRRRRSPCCYDCHRVSPGRAQAHYARALAQLN